jgi:hypothetical protein
VQELVLVYQPIQSPQQTRSKDVIHKRKATFYTQCTVQYGSTAVTALNAVRLYLESVIFAESARGGLQLLKLQVGQTRTKTKITN